MKATENSAAQSPRMSHLGRLESEAIHILREAVAEARNPVMLFSAGKDSTVMAHLALRAFYPGKPPFPFAQVRPVVERDGAWLVVDDPARMRFKAGVTTSERSVRFRTLGCWPVTAAVESEATDLYAIVRETLGAANSERQGRIGDSEDGGSLEQKKREGYF